MSGKSETSDIQVVDIVAADQETVVATIRYDPYLDEFKTRILAADERILPGYLRMAAEVGLSALDDDETRRMMGSYAVPPYRENIKEMLAKANMPEYDLFTVFWRANVKGCAREGWRTSTLRREPPTPKEMARRAASAIEGERSTARTVNTRKR